MSDHPFVEPGSVVFDVPTVRDQFAMAALQGLLAEPDPSVIDGETQSSLRCLTPEEDLGMAERFAKAAYRLADAMMAERDAGA